jgi:hypothetical protein
MYVHKKKLKYFFHNILCLFISNILIPPSYLFIRFIRFIRFKKMNSNLSLYIPYVFVNITEQRIIHVFESLRLGKVRYVDFVSKNARGNVYNSVYVHFVSWYEN